MNDISGTILALFAGAALGAIFFGSLWWTVRRGMTSERPALWFFGSLLLRTSLILVGFFIVSQGHWQRLVLCLIGFVLARAVVVRRLARVPAAEQIHSDKESDVAS
jgi:F1F0 ATPase subunit 2